MRRCLLGKPLNNHSSKNCGRASKTANQDQRKRTTEIKGNSPLKHELSRTEIDVLFFLAPGDQVVARDEAGATWQGKVETTLHEHGILWIQTDIGERKLLDIQEHAIQLLSCRASD